MKRSQINDLIRDAHDFFASNGFFLPPYAAWTPVDWAGKGPEVEEIVDNHLGWDATDYGLNDFFHYGLMLFTLRNGSSTSWARGFNKHYAEKVVILELNQTHQMHHHKRKMEDIINRSGGILAMQVYNAAPDDSLDSSDVRVNLDGVWRSLPAGSVVHLRPGESISITPLLYHRFWAEEKRVLMGEVSDVNDDFTDNYFHQMIGTGRFSEIEEDVPPLHLLCNEYTRYWKAR
jgi:D-lyxose ketol-isomerase